VNRALVLESLTLARSNARRNRHRCSVNCYLVAVSRYFFRRELLLLDQCFFLLKPQKNRCLLFCSFLTFPLWSTPLEDFVFSLRWRAKFKVAVFPTASGRAASRHVLLWRLPPLVVQARQFGAAATMGRPIGGVVAPPEAPT